uniref:ACB domain-containing protein n=1 Tax=Syphacia muris TaxID=451379 RepID=A0A0N5AM70_9BILA
MFYVQLVKDLIETEVEDSNERFTAAVIIVQNLPNEGSSVISNESKLVFYSLYKQSTVGTCQTPKPSFWNVVEKEAWKSLGSMSFKDAQDKYVEMLKVIVDRAMSENNYVFKLDEDNDVAEVLRKNFEKLGYGAWMNFS